MDGTDGDGLDANIYHAHIEFPADKDHYTMALHLRELFEVHGTLESITSIMRRRTVRECVMDELRRLKGWIFRFID
jgi:hypothetical protein